MHKNPFLQNEFDESLITRTGEPEELVEVVREEVRDAEGQRNAGDPVDLSSVRSTTAFRNLVWGVRKTLKHDAHCHVSGTLDDEFLAARGASGDDPDSWIRSAEDLADAVQRALLNHLNDGVVHLELRFNPHKQAFGKPTAERIANVLRTSAERATALEDEAEDRRLRIRFCPSLNRKKYGGELTDLVGYVLQARNHRVEAIDISGPEMQGWECDGKGNLDTDFVSTLEQLADSGLTLVSHLGHSRSVDARFRAKTESNLLHRLHYIEQYITHGVRGIGHGTVLSRDTVAIVGRAPIENTISLLKRSDAWLERCPSSKHKTVADVRDDPVFFWRDEGLPIRLGVDNHRRKRSPCISLSQWIALLSVCDEDKRYMDWLSICL